MTAPVLYDASGRPAVIPRPRNVLLLRVLLVLATATAFATWTVAAILWLKSKPGPAPARTVYYEGARAEIASSNSGVGNIKHFEAWIGAARVANHAWEAQGIRVPAASLLADAGACGSDAIACADTVRNIIYVTGTGGDVDRVTVMLHEFGHLLNVPHIEGDPLMSAIYGNEVMTAPTPAAVALAKSAAEIALAKSESWRWSGPGAGH